MKNFARNVRGFCYSEGFRIPEQEMKKEMGYAAGLQLNSARIWLDPGLLMWDVMNELSSFSADAPARY